MSRGIPCAVVAVILWVAGVASGAEVPRPEHPTPDAMRPHWANLNGRWEFRLDPRDEGLKAGWEKPDTADFDSSIIVPFPWESELSGVHKPGYHGVAWYRRSFTVPPNFPKNDRVWLRFGAIDWRADVWVNGKRVASHEGGYTPFEADVTDAIANRPGGPSVVVVRVFDPTDPSQPTGKQVGWYTSTSGLWQTVWLESRPQVYVADFFMRTETDPIRASYAVQLASPARSEGEYSVTIRSDDSSLKATTDKVRLTKGTTTALAEVRVEVAEPKLWSPESPHLYDVTIEVTGPGGVVDLVKTYFGLRTVARGRFGNSAYERILLNGKPLYLRSALDQSFNPKGIYTAPDDAFLKNDITLAKSLGLNGLRVHIKPDEPRRLYWADRLGLLILEDMPNTWRQNPAARKAWESTMRETVVRDRNHPSILAWVAFNETWGLANDNPEEYKRDKSTQDWVSKMVGEIRKLDPSRLVEDNSPCNYDHVENTDLNSWHFYIDDHPGAARHVNDVVRQTEPGSGFNYCPGKTQGTAPLINSEYGGVSAGGGDRDISWCFRDLTTLLRREPKIQGYVYTELADIEWEHNGFVNYDRSPKTFGYDAFVPGMTPADLNGADFIGYGGPPCHVLKPGQRVSIPAFVSHQSGLESKPLFRWSVAGWGGDGKQTEVVPPVSKPVDWQGYSVWEHDSAVFQAPDKPFVGALRLELIDEKNGKRLAANYVNIVVLPEDPAPRAERRGAHMAVLRFSPNDFSRQSWSRGFAALPGKSSGRGKGQFLYRIKLPQAVAKAKPETLKFRLELAANAGREKVEWAERVNGQDYPQTDGKKWPSTVEIAINGYTVKRVTLADDPADARGVLSHLAARDHGSYGELVEGDLKVDDKLATAIASGEPLAVSIAVPDNAEQVGGVSIYGERMGRYPFDPTIEVTTAEPLPADLGFVRGSLVAVDRLEDRRRTLIGTGDSLLPGQWRYTTNDPGHGWTEPGFDASKWAAGAGGFGSDGTPGVSVKTRWTTPSIWLRSTFDLPVTGTDDTLTLRLFHDENVEVFVNGKSILSLSGYITSYREIELDATQSAAFQPGKNVVAVVCHQTGGGQGIDVGLVLQQGEERTAVQGRRASGR